MADQQDSADVAESQPVIEESNGGEAEVTEAAPADDASELKEQEIGDQPREENKDLTPPNENNESPAQDVPTEGVTTPDASAEQRETPADQEADPVAAELVQPDGDKPDAESMAIKTEAPEDGQVTEEAAAAAESAVEGATEEAAEGADKPLDDGEEGAPVMEPVIHEEAEPLIIESEMPEPGTPEKQESDAEELLLVEEEEVPQYNRDELLQQYQAAMQEREQLTQHNRNLQHKLSEYFRKKKTEEVRPEIEKNTADQEQRYMKYMSNLEELRQQLEVEQEAYKEQLEEMKLRKAEKEAKVEEEWEKATEFKRNVALAAINSRTGRPIPPKDIEMYELSVKKKEQEVSQIRLEFIKLKNRLKKQEAQLKQKEELAEGLHLIDFEQLKIENQTYNEKIEERNEELLKLRKKITNTVQVLTHLKEKLQFVQAENGVKREELAIVEREVAQKRDILSRTKQARDSLRHENNKFQQKCGLLGNSDLLRDFEDSTDEAADLEHRLDLLKRTHAELTLSLNGIKKKIELARDNQS